MVKVKEQKVLCSGIIHCSGKFLIIKRSSSEDIFPDKWEFPSGKVEFGENPLDTLHREILEETGIQISDITFMDLRSYTFETEKSIRHNIELVYLVASKSMAVHLSEAHDEYAWVTLQDVSKYDVFEDIPEQIKKAGKLLLNSSY